LGQILYERNDLDEAMIYLSECITLSQQQNDEETLAYSYTIVARIKQILGEEESALQLIRFAEQQSQKRQLSSKVAIYISLCHARLLLAQGEVEAAYQELQRSDLYNFNHTLQARILLAQCKYEEAGEALDGLFTSSKLSQKIGGMIETQILLALIYQKQSRMFESLKFFERALSLAQKEGYCRLFVDGGPYIGELIEIFLDREQQKGTSLSGSLVEYAKKLLSAIRFSVDDTTLAYKSKFIKFNQSLVEPLRERELEVLYLIAVGLSNQEIAQKMVVAISTVKWHIKNIYSKLNIRSRAEAIALVYKHAQLL
ncbi:MAG TPA: LuxR C-terminal-related transcriptional regulator, partial [Ktedonobacteraceae bacterium]|nr:LuxR C-terminal-related transcriptional regulator [Ktedonobacteraceae bacterium]